MNQNIINARVTFRNSPIHILEQFTIKDMDNAYDQFKKNAGLLVLILGLFFFLVLIYTQ